MILYTLCILIVLKNLKYLHFQTSAKSKLKTKAQQTKERKKQKQKQKQSKLSKTRDKKEYHATNSSKGKKKAYVSKLRDLWKWASWGQKQLKMHWGCPLLGEIGPFTIWKSIQIDFWLKQLHPANTARKSIASVLSLCCNLDLSNWDRTRY